MRYLLGLCLAMLAGCSTLTQGQNARNEELFSAARTCENGSLTVTGISTGGIPETRTVSSGGSEWPVFAKCYTEKARPLWQAYCRKEPSDSSCTPACAAGAADCRMLNPR
jgi:hypothetical protein